MSFGHVLCCFLFFLAGVTGSSNMALCGLAHSVLLRRRSFSFLFLLQRVYSAVLVELSVHFQSFPALSQYGFLYTLAAGCSLILAVSGKWKVTATNFLCCELIWALRQFYFDIAWRTRSHRFCGFINHT